MIVIFAYLLLLAFMAKKVMESTMDEDSKVLVISLSGGVLFIVTILLVLTLGG